MSLGSQSNSRLPIASPLHIIYSRTCSSVNRWRANSLFLWIERGFAIDTRVLIVHSDVGVGIHSD